MLSEFGVEWRKRHERIYVKKKKDFFVGLFFAAKKRRRKTFSFIQFHCCDLNRRWADRGDDDSGERERGRGKEKKYVWTWTRNGDDVRQHQWCCLWRPDPLPRIYSRSQSHSNAHLFLLIFFFRQIHCTHQTNGNYFCIIYLAEDIGIFGPGKKGNETVYLDTSEHAQAVQAHPRKIYYYLSNDNLLSERVFFSFNTKITNNWKIDR